MLNRKNTKNIYRGILAAETCKDDGTRCLSLGLEVAINENGTNSPTGYDKIEFTEGWHNKRNLDEFIMLRNIT
jgi:hypothetical protein